MDHCPYCGEKTVRPVQILGEDGQLQHWVSNTFACCTCGETWGDYAGEWIEYEGGEIADVHRQFVTAFAVLQAAADDFSEGSQQRWAIALRECDALRDDLWAMQQQRLHGVRLSPIKRVSPCDR